MENDLLLSASFVLYPKKSTRQVTLTNNTLTIKSELVNTAVEEEVIHVDDVIGCHLLQGDKAVSAHWYLCIFYYPLKKKLFRRLKRYRSTKCLGVDSCSTDEDNKTLAEKWKKVIDNLIFGIILTKEQMDCIPDVHQRKFIVYINPFSGQGRGMNIYRNQVKPVFGEANIAHTVIKTEFPGHAHKLVGELNLNNHDGIVVVSGDGLINEVINGLMSRPDWKKAIKTPIGIIPGGSGNALAASILYAAVGKHPLPSVLPSSLFQICQGKVCHLDLLAMETIDPENEGKTIVTYGMLGSVIGLISDIDIESEKLRLIGPQRINVYAVLRIATMRNYTLTVSYLPFDESKVKKPGDEASSDDEAISTTDEITLQENHKDSGNAERSLKHNLLPSLDEPVPETWTTVEGRFFQVTALNLSHINEDMLLHRDLTGSDGRIILSQVRSSTTRRTILKVMDCFEDGTGLVESCGGTNDIVVTPCKAFRILPHTKHSEIHTLDGEVMPFGPYQCQIHRSLARVFGTKF